MAEISEYNETAEAIEKTAQLQSLTQQRATDLKLGGEAYESMKAIEYADAIDRFTQSFWTPVSADDIDAEIEAMQHNLHQAQSRKTLEFEVEATTVIAPETEAQQPQISEKAQKLLGYLQRRKSSKESPVSVDRVNKNKIVDGANAAEIRDLFAELTQAGLCDLTDDGDIYLT